MRHISYLILKFFLFFYSKMTNISQSKLYMNVLRLGLKPYFSGRIVGRFLIGDSKQIYFLFSVRTLDSLEAEEKLFYHSQMLRISRLLLLLGFNILFDLSSEAITYDQFMYSGTPLQIIAFHRILQELGLPQNRIGLLTSNSIAHLGYSDFANKHQLTYRIIPPLGYDFWLFFQAHEILNSKLIKNDSQQLLALAKSTVTNNKLRPKHFMCLNLKVRPHRMFITLFLMAIKADKKGILTYIGPNRPAGEILPEKIMPSKEVSDYLLGLPHGDKMIDNYEKLERYRPLLYESQPDEVREEVYRPKYVGAAEYLVPEIKYYNGLKQIDSYFEIVTETYFTDDTCLYITEKTIRAVLRCQFFIIVGMPNTLKALREHGFKTFSPLINEKYDEVSDVQERMILIMNEVERLCTMEIDELHDLYSKMWPIIEHNYRHLLTKIPDIFVTEIDLMLKRL